MIITTQHINFSNYSLFIKKIEPALCKSPFTIVLLHDALGSIAQWKEFPEQLAAQGGYSVILYDRQGHGQSSSFTKKREKDYLHIEALEILPKVLKELKIENPVLVGHSDGGSIALIYAAYFPTTALVAIAAHVLVEDITVQGIKAALLQKEALTTKLKKYHGEKASQLFQYWSNTWLSPSFRNWNIEEILPKITCPSLIIQGAKDEYATLEHLQKIQKGIGENSKTVVLEKCGHFPHKEKEQEVLKIIGKFIDL